jgi:predicted transcriptional regulator
MTVKEQVLSAIERLPEDVGFKDVKDEVAFLAAVQESEDDIAAGRTITNEEMKRRIGRWTGD